MLWVGHGDAEEVKLAARGGIESSCQPRLARLSHFVYNPSGHGGPEDDRDVAPRSHSALLG